MNTYEKIERLRLNAGLSINKLEKECGLSRQTIEKWTSSIPRSDAIVKIAKYFHVTTDYLLGLTDVKESIIQTTKHSPKQQAAISLIASINDEQLLTDIVAYINGRLIEGDNKKASKKAN